MCKANEVLSFSLLLYAIAKPFLNHDRTPRQRLHVWIGSVCGDGTETIPGPSVDYVIAKVNLERGRLHKLRTRTVSVRGY